MSYRSVKWVDPKSVDVDNIDYGVLMDYELLTTDLSTNNGINDGEGNNNVNSTALVVKSVDPPESPSTTNSVSDPIVKQVDVLLNLLTNLRTRIATISSGYKKANYFVREDLDTRIYFRQLEDAMGYMARRGYKRMVGDEEKEWRAILERAHGVVKVGKDKEKQRYRKGKLVVILKKTIRDNDHLFGHDNGRQMKLLTDGDEDSSYPASPTSTTAFSNASETSRTSLGKSIRGQYKSYSEKFLAEVDEEKKRQCLLAID